MLPEVAGVTRGYPLTQIAFSSAVVKFRKLSPHFALSAMPLDTTVRAGPAARSWAQQREAKLLRPMPAASTLLGNGCQLELTLQSLWHK